MRIQEQQHIIVLNNIIKTSFQQILTKYLHLLPYNVPLTQ